MTNKEMYLDTVEDMTSEAFSDLAASYIEGVHWLLDLAGSIPERLNEVETLKRTVEELETKLNKNES